MSVLYQARLENFMQAVADKMNCLPSYADPSPDGDNGHIIQRLDKHKELARLVAEGNFNQGHVINLARDLVK